MNNSALALRKRRKELGLTLEEVGRFVGVSKATVSKWENGNIKNMRSDKVSLLAKVLRLEAMEVLQICNGSPFREENAGLQEEEADSYEEPLFHPEDIAAMKRNFLSDGTKEPKYTLAYLKGGNVVYDSFSRDDYEFIVRTIEMLKGKAHQRKDSGKLHNK